MAVENFLSSYPVVIFMSVVTVYTLFFDDIRVIAFPIEEDVIFYSITSGALIIFVVELVVASVCREVYFMTFFFWLDLVASLSMLPDIGWVWDYVTGQGSTP